METLKKNWKTTLAGAILLICFVGHVLFPETVTSQVVEGTLAVAGSFGLISAKDGNVTGIGQNATEIVAQGLPVIDALTAHSKNPTMQDVHQVIDKLSGAFVQAAQAYQQPAQPAPVVVATPDPAPAPEVINNNVGVPGPADAPQTVDTGSSDFQKAVDAAVNARLNPQATADSLDKQAQI